MKIKLFLSMLALGAIAAFASPPDVGFFVDLAHPERKFEWTTFVGNTPSVPVQILTNGSAYTGFTGYTPELNYFPNDASSAGKTISGTLSGSIATFKALTNSFPAKGDYFGEVFMTLGGDKITCGQGVIKVQRSPSSGSYGALNLSPRINWDIVTSIGTVPWSLLTEPIFLASVAYNITASMTNQWSVAYTNYGPRISILETNTPTLVTYNAHVAAQGNTNSGFQTLFNAQANSNVGFQAFDTAQVNTNAGFQVFDTAQANSNAQYLAWHTAQANTNAGFQALHTAQGNTNAGFESRITANAGYTNEAHTAYGWGNYSTNGFLTNEALWIAQSNSVVTQANNGQTAFGWGNHATNGYITNTTETLWPAVSNTVTINAANGATAYTWGNHASAGYLTTTTNIFTAIYAADRSKLNTNISGLTQGVYTGSLTSVSYTGVTVMVVGRTYAWGFTKANAFGTSTLSIASQALTRTAAGTETNHFTYSGTDTNLILKLDGDGSSKSDVTAVYLKQITGGVVNVAGDVNVGGVMWAYGAIMTNPAAHIAATGTDVHGLGTMALQSTNDYTNTVAKADSALQPGAAGTSTNLGDYNNDALFVTASVTNDLSARVDGLTNGAALGVTAWQPEDSVTNAVDESARANNVLTSNAIPTTAAQVGAVVTPTNAWTVGHVLTTSDNGTTTYATAESDPVWESEKAGYATGTPLYVETYLGTITGATIADGAATGVTTNGGVLAFTVVSNTPEQYTGTLTNIVVNNVTGTVATGVASVTIPAGSGTTNQIMDVNGVLYTITNAPAANDVIKFNPASSTAVFAAESGGGTFDHTALTNVNGNADVQHLTALEKTGLETNTAALHGGTLIEIAVAGTNWTWNYLGTNLAFGITDTTMYRGDWGAAASSTASTALQSEADTNALTQLETHSNTPAMTAHPGLDTAATNPASAFATAAQGATADAALPKAGGTMTGPLTNDVAIWLPANGTVYFGTATNYIQDQGGTNFLFKSGVNSANFAW